MILPTAPSAFSLRWQIAPRILSLGTSLLVWRNDHVAFGGMHKMLRRMWMAADSYTTLSTKLRDIWLRS